ncbi:MAG: hypothetical protein AB1451_01650 [Nitrospirota bacterium]
MNDRTSCPACKTAVRPAGIATTRERIPVDCPNCGRYQLTRQAELGARPRLASDPEFAMILAHAIRRMQRNNEWPVVNSDLIERIEREGRLPDPAEQADNLVIWIGDMQRHPGEMIPLDYDNSRAVVGAFDAPGVRFIAKSLYGAGLVEFTNTDLLGRIGLTFAGWQRYHLMRRQSTTSPRAFMAMKYNDPILDQKIYPKFKEATREAGFDLVRLDDAPRAGLIDEQLRVEIRRARFLVADLTHDNSGAYWEAGFAEGLGKPVIYTCETGIFESRGTHFDTNHSHTIRWVENDPVDAARRLKATIRATFPEEARIED